jgi:NAD(P)-dependent dehydrogenase (short-subunit alcohol dehydrogenase family)
MSDTTQGFPRQSQPRPGHEDAMRPAPRAEMEEYVGSGKLDGLRALVTGGDSGIGRAVSIAFAKEGADVAIAYLSEHADAGRTAELVDAQGRTSITIPGDLSRQEACAAAVQRTVDELGGLDVLVNNIAYQKPVDEPEELTAKQWERTIRTNIHSYFWTTRPRFHICPAAARSSTPARSTACAGTGR